MGLAFFFGNFYLPEMKLPLLTKLPFLKRKHMTGKSRSRQVNKLLVNVTEQVNGASAFPDRK
jgi:hypothetical protein